MLNEEIRKEQYSKDEDFSEEELERLQKRLEYYSEISKARAIRREAAACRMAESADASKKETAATDWYERIQSASEEDAELLIDDILKEIQSSSTAEEEASFAEEAETYEDTVVSHGKTAYVPEKKATETVPEKDPASSAVKPKKREAEQEQKRKPQKTAVSVQSQAPASSRLRTSGKAVKKLQKETNRQWKKEAGNYISGKMISANKKKAAIWNTAVSLTLLFGIAAGMVLLERPTISNEENRTLARMPVFSVDSYLSGEYTNGVSEYYNDTVPMRSTFKGMIQSIRKYMGLNNSSVIHGGVPVLQEEEPAVTTTTLPPVTTMLTQKTRTEGEETETTTTVTEAAEEEPEKEGEISNSILVVDNRGIMLFGGWEKMGEPYANILNRYKQDLPEVNVYSMVVPTVCSYYIPENLKHLVSSEKANIDYIGQCLENVTPVDVYSALEKHKDEPIYMRTDHHWAGLGAFYAAEAFSAEARVPFARIEEYEKHSKEGYVGTLYGYSNDIKLKENPEEFVWYTPKCNYTTTFISSDLSSQYETNFFANIDGWAPVSWYMVYMSGDDHIVHLETEVKNGRRLAVIKDSYGNALIPWLTSSFEEIYVIDMRYFGVNVISYMREKGITDLLFAMNSFSANGTNAQKMETIRVQP
ncbi:MAG: DHHW family protein [Oscillospiraceae bacterium]|nr:DHHW family protein [Oscillospiraceae bacterium]